MPFLAIITFDFQQDGTGTCFCGNGVEVVVDESDLADLVYDGTIKPEEVKITVTLDCGALMVYPFSIIFTGSTTRNGASNS